MEDNKKFRQILAAARDLFWKHGFKRITVEEICLKADVSKMTFYKFFPDKISVAKAVFQKEVLEGMKVFRNILEDDSTPQEKIGRILRMKSQSTKNISKEFLHDFYTSEKTELKTFVQELTASTWKDAILDFKKAQEKGIFRHDMKPEFLFYLSQKLGESLTDENLLALYESPHDLLIELSKMFGYGISPRENNHHPVKAIIQKPLKKKK